MIAAVGLAIAALGALLLWGALTGRSVLDEVKAAVGVEVD